MLETIEKLYGDCWRRGDFDLIPEILHPEIVWTAIESAPDAGTRRGYGEVRGYMEDWLEGFDLGAHLVEPAGRHAKGVVCALHATATEKRSGLTTDLRYAGLFGFADDGRIVEIREFATVPEALEAAGLPK